MKYIVLSLILMLELVALENVTYKCYKQSYIKKDDKRLATDGEIKNHTKVVLDGIGKVVFFYPCGAPSIIDVNKKNTFKVEHQCKNNSLVKSLVIAFFDEWFTKDEKIVISASSRSVSHISRGDNYFIVDKKSVKSINIPIYDEEAEYILNINDKDYDIKAFMSSELIKIPSSLLEDKFKNKIKIYEDNINIYNFSVEYIDKQKLEKKYESSKLSFLEKVLNYEQESNSRLYTNSDISYLLK